MWVWPNSIVFSYITLLALCVQCGFVYSEFNWLRAGTVSMKERVNWPSISPAAWRVLCFDEKGSRTIDLLFRLSLVSLKTPQWTHVQNPCLVHLEMCTSDRLNGLNVFWNRIETLKWFVRSGTRTCTSRGKCILFSPSKAFDEGGEAKMAAFL